MHKKLIISGYDVAIGTGKMLLVYWVMVHVVLDEGDRDLVDFSLIMHAQGKCFDTLGYGICGD